MGYANDSVLNGKAKSVCSQFIKIGTDGTEMTLGDLTPGGGWKKTDNIKILGDAGQVKVKAYYITQAEIDALVGPQRSQFPSAPGWYNSDSVKQSVGEEDIPAGTGFIASTATTWQSVPEPTSGLLLLLGVAGLALKRRRA